MREKLDQRGYLLGVLARTGWNQTELAKRAGLDPSTLSRFLSSPSGSQNLRPATLRRIVQVTGVAFEDLPPAAAPVPAGFSEPEATALQGEVSPLVTLILQHLRAAGGAIDPWTLKSRALEQAGYRPGDVLFVSLGQTALRGDIVCAQVYDWSANRTETLFRIYEPPYLVAATTEAALMRPHEIDNERVALKGVVLHTLRNR